MPTEMQSKSTDSQAARPASELDPQALAAIRNLLDAEPAVVPKPVPKRQAEQAARATATPQVPLHAEHSSRDHVGPEQPAPTRKAKGKAKRVKKSAQGGGFMSSLTSFRPAPKHVVFAALGFLVFFRPWLVIGLLFLSLFTMAGIFLILGYDGFWRRAMGLARWYATRRPERAASMHRRLDAFAMRWDAILDRFPEGSVDGLYLPDFGDLAAADARHDAALDRRFATLREGEA